MRLCSLCLFVASASWVAAKSSFENTAPLLVSNNKEYHYIVKAADAQKYLTSLSNDVCETTKESPNLLYLRIQGLDDSDLSRAESLISGLSTRISKFADHVLYDRDQVDLRVADSCNGNTLTINSKGLTDEQWIDLLLKSKSKVNVVELYKEGKSKLADSLKKLSLVYTSDNVIIQGLPTFQKQDTILKLASQKLKELTSLGRRDYNDEVTEEDFDKIQQELDDSFRAINELLEGDDEIVHAYDEETGNGVGKDDTPYVFPEGSLFDRYTFFSSGIWMAIIVSSLLFSVVAVALSWLNSVQISYGAFEKPVNVAKKTQ
ncbi:DEKNAAC101750 [Brettanomyces naardenensis]|uniref:Protein BIG1 n=1 Tax=Brettanomyces naardenensis TaxID=13370 RepID=A0A448YIT1_BRENA|nr:DEKNAAC101750 [Brettanomyces naardenensis]